MSPPSYRSGQLPFTAQSTPCSDEPTDYVASAADDDSAALRAVHAFLLDDASSFPLDTEDEGADTDAVLHSSPPLPPSLSPLSLPATPIDRHGHATTSDSGGASDTPHISPINPTMGKASKCPPPRRRPQRINHSRVRLKKEILLLRQQAIALDARLATIQVGQSDAASTTPDTMVVAWKTVALDQRAQRATAESEREKLREVVREYKRGFQRVRRFLRKRKPLMSLDPSLTSTTTTPARLMTETDAEAAFEAMAQELQTMYEQLDAVFTVPGVDDLVDSISALHIENDMAADMRVELREARVLPFGAAAVAAAIWTMRQNTVANFAVDLEQESFETENRVHRTFTATANFRSYRGVLQGLHEARRSVEDGRHVLLQCTRLTRGKRRDDDAEKAIGCRFLSWTIVRPVTRAATTHGDAPSGATTPVSKVEVYSVAKPFQVSASGEIKDQDASTPESRVIRDFCVEAVGHVRRTERQVVENILMDYMQRTEKGSTA